MFRMVLVASLSEANSGHTVMAGKSSSLSLTLSMVLVPGSSSQELKNMKKFYFRETFGTGEKSPEF